MDPSRCIRTDGGGAVVFSPFVGLFLPSSLVALFNYGNLTIIIVTVLVPVHFQKCVAVLRRILRGGGGTYSLVRSVHARVVYFLYKYCVSRDNKTLLPNGNEWACIVTVASDSAIIHVKQTRAYAVRPSTSS